ncbi:CMD domain-containing protein [Candidatus Pantoea formicae]|uniref:CMD domain-containing protein n=1 Tax=Candidatus Pantoea formicae TaxID=2608355 RepID=UPI003ED90D01
MSDAIDQAAGLTPEDALYQTRRLRPEFVEGAEACRVSVLAPEDDQGLPADLRLALAQRMAVLNYDAPLQRDYQAQLAALNPSEALLALASGCSVSEEPLATIARHADMVTQQPIQATEQHIRLLEQAGLSNPQIVALSELIAFVNFQTRVAAGLRLLRSA